MCTSHDELSPAIRRIVREAREEAQDLAMSPAATRAFGAGNRDRAEAPDPYRTCFERDRDRIVHSLAFRRLKHKTQVFINPEGDHTITRLTHVLQVAQVAEALAAAMGLNTALAEAMALGHDVGHTPFGHAGEDALDTRLEGGWVHSYQSVRIYEVLEPINLCVETREGIARHPWKINPPPATPEGWCVRYADRIAYLAHDVMDAMRAGLINEQDLPKPVTEALGPPGSKWITRLIQSVVDYSVGKGHVEMDPKWFPVFDALRDWMFERVYKSPEQEKQARAAHRVIYDLFDFYLANPDKLPVRYRDMNASLEIQVADHVAGMTDRYALQVHDQLFRPRLFDQPHSGLT